MQYELTKKYLKFAEEYGFDIYEHRLFSRMLVFLEPMRTTATSITDYIYSESMPSIAKACKMTESKTRDSIKLMSIAGVITYLDSPGIQRKYFVRQREYWVNSDRLEMIRSSILTKKNVSNQTVNSASNLLPDDKFKPDANKPCIAKELPW